MPPPVCSPPAPAPWRSYPYQLVAGDPQLVFPAAEGHQDVASDTYYASGVLRGETSGRRYAFLTIFAKNLRPVVGRPARAGAVRSRCRHLRYRLALRPAARSAAQSRPDQRHPRPVGGELHVEPAGEPHARPYRPRRRPAPLRLRIRPQRRSPIGNGDGAPPVRRRAEAAPRPSAAPFTAAASPSTASRTRT